MLADGYLVCWETRASYVALAVIFGISVFCFELMWLCLVKDGRKPSSA